MRKPLLLVYKTKACADQLNYYCKLDIMHAHTIITRGMIDGKRVYFRESIDWYGNILASMIYTSFTKLMADVTPKQPQTRASWS